MLIVVQGQITTYVVLQRGSLHSTPKTFSLTGMISYAGHVEWGLPFFESIIPKPRLVLSGKTIGLK